MATAVLDLELSSVPDTVSVSARYERALCLIRLRGYPVGQALLPVQDGHIGPGLHQALVKAGGKPVQERALFEWLAPAVSTMPTRASVTVAICTRDRPDDVDHCLAAVMRLPDDGQEVLLIDNCPSSEATRRVVERYAKVRYVREPRPGLDIARNRALKEALHPIVAFTDDDAAPDPGWLRALAVGFNDPQVACVTGLTMPRELETAAQESFERYTPFGKGFRRTVFDGGTRNPLAVGNIGAGANMAVRRAVFDEIGLFDEALDAGTPTRSGGDHEMFVRMLAAGYRIVYDPAALSWHRHRRTWDELHSAVYGYGVGVYAMWTRLLLTAGELGVFRQAFEWFRHDQARAVARTVRRRRNRPPLRLVFAELSGCVAGPWAYLTSRRQLQRRGEPA